MLSNWIYRNWKHNRTHTKLAVFTRQRMNPYWVILVVMMLAYAGVNYSITGIVLDIFPNTSLMKDDVIIYSKVEIKTSNKKKSI